MISFATAKTRLLFVALFLGALARISLAGPLAPQIANTDLDTANLSMFISGVATPPPYEAYQFFQTTTIPTPSLVVSARFGTATPTPVGNRDMRVNFKRSIPIGTVITGGEVTVSVLKPTAAYPGNPNNDADWIFARRVEGTTVDPTSRLGEFSLVCWVLPDVISTRAIRFTKVIREDEPWGMSYFSGAYVYPQRLNNISPQATIFPSSNPGAATYINNGNWEVSTRWDNGAAGGANVISPTNPEKLVFLWPTNVTLAGFATHVTGFRDGKVQRFIGPDDHHPRDAADNEWETVTTFSGLSFFGSQVLGINTIDFNGTSTSRAFRILIEKAGDPTIEPALGSSTSGGKRVFVGEIMALYALGTNSLESSLVARGCDLPAPIPLTFHLDKKGYVTLVIERADGVRVRNLVSETLFEAGDHVIYWDGLDESGKKNLDLDGQYEVQGALVPAGNYRLRGLIRDGLELHYEFTVNAAGDPPWQAGALGGWLSDHRPPSDIVYLPKSNELMLVCETAESGYGGLFLDLNGNKKGFIGVIEDGFYIASHLSQDRGPLADPNIITYSAIMSKNRLMIHSVDTGKNFTRLMRVPVGDGVSPTTNVLNGFAVWNKVALLSIAVSNTVTIYDTSTKTMLGSTVVPSPRGMTFDSAGRLLLLSGNSLLRATVIPSAPFVSSVEVIINGALDDPRRITYQPSTGNMYISEWGNSHDVKVFASDGTFLRTIGTTGPVGVGLYDTNHMHYPNGVVVAPDNKLWVMEYDTAPKRVSVWDLSGNLQKAYYGPPKYGGGGRLDPDDRTRFYYSDNDPDDPVSYFVGMEWKLNWTDGSSYLRSVYARWNTNTSDEFLKTPPPETAVRMNGRQYMINTFNDRDVSGSVVGAGIWEMVGNEVKMRAFIGADTSWPKLLEPQFIAALPPGFTRGTTLFLWSDLNGDYKVQPSEVTYRSQAFASFQVLPNLDLTTLTGLHVPLLGFNATGAPLYNLAAATNFAVYPQPAITSGGAEVLQGTNGMYLVTGGPMRGYKEGKEIWTYPSQWPSLHSSQRAPNSTVPRPPGLMIGTTRLLGPQFTPSGGEAGEMWMINGNKGDTYLFTMDGLFVSTLFNDSRDHPVWGMPSLARNGMLNDVSLAEECFWPSVVKTDDGNVYMTAGKNHSGIVRIDGLNSIQRLPAQNFTVSSDQLAACIQYQIESEACRIGKNADKMYINIATVPPTIDGSLADWASTNFVQIDSKATGAVVIANGKLYAAWQTESATLADNTGLVPNALFKSGGALDLMIGMDPSAASDRPQAVLGDIRLTIARVNGSTKALLYRPVSAAGTPVTFTSPVRSLTIQQVEDVSSDVQFAGAGGRFEIAIPLSRLGFNPTSGMTIKGDIGVLRGLNGATYQRSYWHNQATGLVNDTPTEAELDPALWGRWEFHGATVAPLAITSATPLPSVQVNSAYSQTFAASGGTGGYSWSISAGALPNGLTLSALGGLTGTPTLSGVFSFTVKVTDSSSSTLEKAFTLTVNAIPLGITTTTLPTNVVNLNYSASLAAIGGKSPYTWTVSSGALPPGLNLNAGGSITGIPTASGAFTFTAQVTDDNDVTATRQFTLVVVQPLSLSSTSPLTPGKAGTTYSFTFAATGGLGGNLWTLNAGTLPAGLTLTTAGNLVGTPTVAGNYSFNVKVADASGAFQTRDFSITINPSSIVITTSSPIPAGQVGVPYSLTFSSVGGAGTLAWTVSTGPLPAGLTLSSTGVLSGSPTVAGTFFFIVRVTDSVSATDTRGVTMTVAPAPIAVSTTSPLSSGEVGAAYSLQLAATGGKTPFTWSVTAGALPAGLNLGASGIITGSPTAAGSFTFTAQVTDANNTSASRQFTVTIAPQLTISSVSPLAAGQVNVAYNFTFTATGGLGGNVWTLNSGSLPNGLSLNSAGTLSGIPTVAGSFTFNVKVADTSGFFQTRDFSVTINPPTLLITTASPILSGQATVPYSVTFTSTGGAGGNVWSVFSGSLPSGLTLSPAGVLSGTPTVDGAFTFSVRVTDSASSTDTRSIAMTVTPAPLVISTPASLPPVLISAAYSQQLTATGGKAPYAWTITAGSLPTGLNLNSGGTISGNPSVAGAFTFTAKITDANNVNATRQFTLTVVQQLAISTTSPLTPGKATVPYTFTFAATGGFGGNVWTLNGGTLPTGLTLTSGGNLVGIPTTTGSFNFNIKVADSSGAFQTRDFNLVVGPATVVITTSSPIPSAQVGVPYSKTFSSAGGVGTLAWTISSGPLPAGLSLSSDGVLSGTPTANGTFFFIVRVNDNSTTDTRGFTITIAPAPISISTVSPLPPGQVGAIYSLQFTASGGIPVFTWSILDGTLPSGLSLDPSGLLSGAPTVFGDFSFTVKAIDSANAFQTKAMLLTIIPQALAIDTVNLPPVALGASYAANLSGHGGVGGYNWTLSAGTLPPGLSLSALGAVTGIPTAPGVYNFTVQLADSANVKTTKDLSIAVINVLRISTVTLSNAGKDFPYLQTLTAAGGTPPYSWDLTDGNLPEGLALDPDGNITGSARAEGAFTFTVRVMDAVSASVSKDFTLTVPGPFTILTDSLSNGVVGVSYSQPISTSGGLTPFTFAVTAGALPPGLSLSADGVLTGAPTITGNFSFTVTGIDSTFSFVVHDYTISVSLAPLTINSSTLTAGAQGVGYTQKLDASGGAPTYTWSLLDGALPPGLSLTFSGSIWGVPTAQGSFNFTASVTDRLGTNATKTITLNIAPTAVAVQTTALDDAVLGASYSQTLAASGGVGGYVWTIVSGALPDGITLDPTGLLSGAATNPGTSLFTLRATDTANVSQTKTLSIFVRAAGLAVTTKALANANLNGAYSMTLHAAGGTPNYTWSITAGTLPTGLTLGANGVLSGTPTQTGTFNITLSVTDATTTSATRALSLVVQPAILNITTGAQLASSSVNLALVRTLVATGGTPPYTWSVIAGAIPTGLSFSSSGSLVSIPTVPGEYGFTARVTDSAQNTAVKDFKILINPGNPSSAGGGALAQGVVTEPYSAQVVTSGGIAPFRWALSSGALPPGLLVASSLSSTGLVTGTPTTPGAYSFSLAATDALNKTATLNYTMNVTNAPLAVVTTRLPAGKAGTAYSRALIAKKGVPPYTWTVASGDFPPGLSLATSGTITGAPLPPGGVFSFAVQVTDAIGANVAQNLSISIDPSVGLSPREIWRIAKFGANANSPQAADGADPDGDGLVNIVEYALGLDPLTPNTGNRPKPQVQTIAGKKYLTLTYTQDSTATDVVVVIQSTSQLGTAASWTANIVEISRTGTGVETVTVRDSVSLDEAATRFLRINVTQ